MLDLFTIFSKGGIVLWCFQGTNQTLTSSVNALIKTVILQERGGSSNFQHGNLTLKYKLDNEFELVFVVAYQKILQLSYVDKFLSAIQLEFRNKYKDDLQQGKISRNFDFDEQFKKILKLTEDAARAEAKAPSTMRSFDESDKSKKKVSSMMENKYTESANKSKKSQKQAKKEAAKKELESSPVSQSSSEPVVTNGDEKEEEIRKNREKFMMKMKGGSKPKPEAKSPQSNKKKGKEGRVWDLGGKSADAKNLDFSGLNGEYKEPEISQEEIAEERSNLLGKMKGNLEDIEEEYSNWENEETISTNAKKGAAKSGWLSSLKGLVGAKALEEEDILPMMDKMKDELITKNVAADIADKLCQSVSTKLKGRVLGTFNTVSSTVKSALYESCMQILIPKRRVNILRDAMSARDAKRPYVITFCGVNGVGKSTNLAKVCFWLIENGFRVLIAACDTFRAGAVEQLRTHRHKLNALHPAEQHNGQTMVELYEKGYGKDAAGIAMEAINFARDKRIDVVLVDTAGRMQDNEPLMRALSKLIKVNQPDLVLFVGEALVGNEAVDQLTKFNQALADHSNMENPRLIDGIVLTKFDTIDDKVGAAISMTYTTGQPIVFVGTGQTYTDLKNLNAKAVVNALLK